jgi:DNA-binding NarL/FixJ family response regulator
MDDVPQTSDFLTEFDELRRVKAEALSHWVKAQEFHQQRKTMIKELIAKGFSQADIARELGVTRQAIQKMLTL